MGSRTSDGQIDNAVHAGPQVRGWVTSRLLIFAVSCMFPPSSAKGFAPRQGGSESRDLATRGTLGKMEIPVGGKCVGGCGFTLN